MECCGSGPTLNRVPEAMQKEATNKERQRESCQALNERKELKERSFRDERLEVTMG